MTIPLLGHLSTGQVEEVCGGYGGPLLVQHVMHPTKDDLGLHPIAAINSIKTLIQGNIVTLLLCSPSASQEFIPTRLMS